MADPFPIYQQVRDNRPSSKRCTDTFPWPIYKYQNGPRGRAINVYTETWRDHVASRPTPQVPLQVQLRLGTIERRRVHAPLLLVDGHRRRALSHPARAAGQQLTCRGDLGCCTSGRVTRRAAHSSSAWSSLARTGACAELLRGWSAHAVGRAVKEQPVVVLLVPHQFPSTGHQCEVLSIAEGTPQQASDTS